MKYIFLHWLLIFSCSVIEPTFESENTKNKSGSIECVVYWNKYNNPNDLIYRLTRKGYSKKDHFENGHFKIDGLKDGRYSLSIFNANFDYLFYEYQNIRIQNGSITLFTVHLPVTSDQVSQNEFIISYDDTLKSGQTSGIIDLTESDTESQNEFKKGLQFFGNIFFERNNDIYDVVKIPVDSLGSFYADDIKPGIYNAHFSLRTNENKVISSPRIVGIVVLPGKESVTQHRFLSTTYHERVLYERLLFNFFWHPNFKN